MAPRWRCCDEARAHYPVSLHGVGLALGSAAGLDEWHLQRLQRLVQRIEPVRVSDHACFARAPRAAGAAVLHGNDLLPIAFTDESLDLMVANVQRVQERLRRPLLVENLSAYLGWADDHIGECDFFNQLTRRSGCGVLLDREQPGRQRAECRRSTRCARRVTGSMPSTRRSVGEIHLAGFNDCGDIVIDDHGSRVHAPVWQVYAPCDAAPRAAADAGGMGHRHPGARRVAGRGGCGRCVGAGRAADAGDGALRRWPTGPRHPAAKRHASVR